MSLFERRVMRRHPLLWLRAYAFQWTVGCSLIVVGILSAHPVFAPVVGYRYHIWPLTIVGVGILACASSFAVRSKVMQSATGAALFGIAVFRGAAYVELIVSQADHSSAALVIAGTMAMHWAIIGGVGLRWTRVAVGSALDIAVLAGRDERVG